MNPILLLLAIVTPSQAPKDPPPPKINNVALSVSSAKAPLPKLRYELLPNTRDLKAGNAAVSYHRAILLLNERVKPKPEEWQKLEEELQKALDAPISDTPKEVLRKHVNAYAKALSTEIAFAARCQSCDWGHDARPDNERLFLLLPELQKLRELARFQQIKTRLAIAEGRIEDAIADLQTGFALGRHASEGGSFITDLVGIAITSIFTGEVEKLMTHPKSPNLYYALSHLPQPILNRRKAVEGEMRLLDSIIPKLKDIEGKMTAEDARKEMEKFQQRFSQISGVPDGPLDAGSSRLAMAGLVTLRLPNAKKFVMELGRTEEEVNAMPALQVILLESTIKVRDLRDDLLFCFDRPTVEAIKLSREMNMKIIQARRDQTDVLLTLTGQLFPSGGKVIEAHYRTERKLATLQTIEAIRMHESSTGKVPEKLSDIKIVPVPKDPGTGKDFEYQVTPKGFTITAPPISDLPIIPGTMWKYEMTLTK